MRIPTVILCAIRWVFQIWLDAEAGNGPTAEQPEAPLSFESWQ